MPLLFPPALQQTSALLAECPAGRELLELAADKNVLFRARYNPFTSSRGSFREVYGDPSIRPVIRVNEATSSAQVLCTLAHELEHNKQSYDGILWAPEQAGKVQLENPDAVRNHKLVCEAGAMAKTAVVLCQLLHRAEEFPERAREFQQLYAEACQDQSSADLYQRCRTEMLQDPQSLYNGIAFQKTAEQYCDRPDRVTYYVGAAAAECAENCGHTNPADLKKYRDEEISRYQADKNVEYRTEVHGQFLAALPLLFHAHTLTPGPGPSKGEKKDLKSELAAKLDQRLATLELPPMRERELMPERDPTRTRDRSLDRSLGY